MAPLTCSPIVMVVVLLATIGVAVAQDSQLGRMAPWRPTELSPDILKPDLIKAHKAALQLSYANDDAERLIIMALALPPAESVPALIRYTDRILKTRGKTDIVWSRAVFSLGATRSEAAAKYIMDQWDGFDSRLANGTTDSPKILESGTIEPLYPLSDGLHFCFDTPGVREWAMKRINDEIAKPEGVDLPTMHRRSARIRMLMYLIRWDIAESGDSRETLRPEQLLESQMATPTTPQNLDASCKAVVEWAGRMPVLPLNANEKQWQQVIAIESVHAFDTEAAHIGLPLALKLHEVYLRPTKDEDNDKQRTKNKVVDLRPELRAWAWWVASLAVLNDATLGRGLRPDGAVKEMLKDAADYYLQLPRGEVRKNGAKCLFTIQCYLEPEPTQPFWQAIAKLAKSDLTSQDQEIIVARIAHFRGTASASKN